MSNFQIGRENTSVHSLTCHPKVVPVTYSGTKRPGSRDVRSLGEKLFQLESFISFYFQNFILTFSEFNPRYLIPEFVLLTTLTL